MDSSLKIDVDVDAAIKALDALANAAERANKALAELGINPHDGVTVQVAGDLAVIKIKPPKSNGNTSH